MQLMKLKSSEGKTEAIIREHIITHTLEKRQWLVQFPQPSGEWQRFGRQPRWWARSARAICHVDDQGVWHPGQERSRDALSPTGESHGTHQRVNQAPWSTLSPLTPPQAPAQACSYYLLFVQIKTLFSCAQSGFVLSPTS